jgi:hypothetical protein
MKDFSRNLLLGLWILIMIAGTIVTCWGVAHESLWFDESYTAAMTNHAILNIINMSADDVHPPLYYVMLALGSLGIGPVQRIFGIQGAVIFTVLVFIHPISLSLAQGGQDVYLGVLFCNSRRFVWLSCRH